MDKPPLPRRGLWSGGGAWLRRRPTRALAMARGKRSAAGMDLAKGMRVSPKGVT
jgi:hypothetical protein